MSVLRRQILWSTRRMALTVYLCPRKRGFSSLMLRVNSDTHKARSIQDIIGHPSTVDYIKYVEQGLTPNCPITKEDIICAEDILGPNLGSLKGKTTRKTPERVTTHLTIYQMNCSWNMVMSPYWLT